MVILTTPDVNVIILNFPVPGKEMVVPNEDGSYTILLNAKLSIEERMKAYEHAMRHIKDEDFSKTDAQAIEYQAHNITVSETAERIPADKFQKELERIRRRKKKIQEQIQEYERDMRFIEAYSRSNDSILKSEENRWLYGGL